MKPAGQQLHDWASAQADANQIPDAERAAYVAALERSTVGQLKLLGFLLHDAGGQFAAGMARFAEAARRRP